ncbi:MAG: ABC transporter permease [Firmicutes bacterium]|nr:ABC transporter permease [Bacillota bacterium]
MTRRFFRQAWLYFKGSNAAFNFEEFALLELSYPLLTLIFFVVLAAYSFNASDLTHWVVGNSFLLCVNTTLFMLGVTFDGERQYGRLRSIIVSPTNKLVIVLQKAVFPILTSIVTVAVGFVIGALIFRVDFTHINLGLLLVAIVVSMFSSAGLGILFATVSLLSDSVHFILNTMSYVLMIFCGANFPIAQLPVWGQIISRGLPLTRGIQAANLLFTRFELRDFLSLIVGEVAVGAAYFLAAFTVIKFAERAAIKRASFEMF